MLTCKLPTVVVGLHFQDMSKVLYYDFNYYYDCIKYYFTLILQLGDKEIKIQSLIPIVKELGLKFSVDSGVSYS